MSSNSRRALLIVVILLSVVLLAAGDVFCHALVVQELTGVAPEGEPGSLAAVVQAVIQAFGKYPHFVWFFGGAPLLIGLMLIVLVALSGGPARAPRAAETDAADDPATAGALRLLGLLQQEGRLVDFLEEDIEPYSDAQVGAAVRAIHSGCRQALHSRMHIERIYDQEDGAAVDIPPGFDAAAVRLTGAVRGGPPFRGVLQHGGWRASDVALPRGAGSDASVLAPAEVEVG